MQLFTFNYIKKTVQAFPSYINIDSFITSQPDITSHDQKRILEPILFLLYNKVTSQTRRNK